MKLMTSNIFTNHKLDYLFGREKIFMKMSTKNFLDLMYRKKTKKIDHASTIIKVAFKLRKLRQYKLTCKKYVPKIQSAVRNFLRTSKLLKKKKAVLVIEDYWIKYCHQFFLRKRRNHVIAVQKYIKRAI